MLCFWLFALYVLLCAVADSNVLLELPLPTIPSPFPTQIRDQLEEQS